MRDLRDHHRAALAAATEVVRGVGPEGWDRVTPCPGWDVAGLVAHQVGQNHGFATAVRHGDASRQAYRPARLAPVELPAAWAASAAALGSAFEAADLGAEVRLVEVRPDSPLTVGAALGIHLLDTVGAHLGPGDQHRPLPPAVG